MKFEDYPLGYPFYMLFKDNDGFYLSTSTGQIATLEEVEYLAKSLISYAKAHKKDIEISNLQNELEFMRSYYGEAHIRAKKKLPKKRHVYMIKCGDKYKIGVSKDVDRRIKELDNRPFPVKLIAKSGLVHCAFEAEKKAHRQLEEYKVDGEWFMIPKELVNRIADLIRYINDATYGYGED